jgi:hypothetical protein
MLEMLAKAAVASQFPGFSRWVFAGEHEHEHSESAPAPPRSANYEPQFFSAHEYRTIDVLTELIIPRDETPGASEAGVSEFIDFMASHGEEELQPMRPGLLWLDNKARSDHGRNFLELPPGQQMALLKNISRKENTANDDAVGRRFFLLVRRYTVMGYYTSKVGLEELDFPGLRLYSQSPACPHKDDPEHKHLPPPRF